MESAYWLALVAESAVSCPWERDFQRTARQRMEVLAEGCGYRRSPWYDLSVPSGSERYRTMVLRGNGQGVSPWLFVTGASRLVPLKDLEYRVEFRPSSLAPGMLCWPYRTEPGHACAQYERIVREGRFGLERGLAVTPGVQEAVDAVCAETGYPMTAASVGVALYTDEFVIDRRHDGAWALAASRPYSPTAWRW